MAAAKEAFDPIPMAKRAIALLNYVFSIPNDFQEEMCKLLVKVCENTYWNKKRPTDDAEKRCLAFEYGSIDIKFLAICAEVGIVNILRTARTRYPYDFYIHINPDGLRVTYQWSRKPLVADTVELFPKNTWDDWQKYRSVPFERATMHKAYVEERREIALLGSQVTSPVIVPGQEDGSESSIATRLSSLTNNLAKHYCECSEMSAESECTDFVAVSSETKALVEKHSSRPVKLEIKGKEVYDPNVIAEVATSFLMKTFALAPESKPHLHRQLIRHCLGTWDTTEPSYGAQSRVFVFLYGQIDPQLLSMCTAIGIDDTMKKARQLFPYDFSLHLDPDCCALKVSWGDREDRVWEEVSLFPGVLDLYMKAIKKHLRHFREHIKQRHSMITLPKKSIGK